MRGQGKYGVAPKAERTSRDGIVFDSKGELARWEVLRLLEKAGKLRELRRQVRYELVVNGVKIGTYAADFEYIVTQRNADGELLIVEDFKGVRTPAYQMKKKLMKALYGIEIMETGRPERRPQTKNRRE